MAEITVYVDPDASGAADGSSWTDAYNSLNAAEAAKQGDYVTDTDNYVYLCRSSGGTADGTAVTIDGSTTSTTYNIRIKSDDDHEGAWSSSLYRLALANAVVLTIADNWVTLEGLQIESTGTNANYQSCLVVGALGSGARVYIDSCIFKSSNSATYRERVITFGLGGDTRYADFYNNVIWNINDAPVSVANSGLHFSSGTINLYNNTFSGGYNNIYYVAGTVNAYNNIFAGAANAVGGTWNNADYNASDYATTTGGANDINSATFTFVDAANGDFHLAAGDSSGCKGGGTDDPGSGLYSDDFEGDTRVSSWDIGADEYIVAGGMSISVSDVISLAESLTDRLYLPTVVNDVVTIVDLISNIVVPLATSVNDAISIAEAITMGLQSAGLSTSDAVTIVENVLARMIVPVFTNDTISISEVSVAALVNKVFVSDLAISDISAFEYINVAIFTIASVFDNITLIEAVAILINPVAVVTENISVIEYINIVVGVLVDIIEEIALKTPLTKELVLKSLI